MSMDPSEAIRGRGTARTTYPAAPGVIAGRLVPDVQRHDWTSFRAHSVALDRYARRDFAGVRQRLNDVFGPETASEMVAHPVALINRMEAEHADAYVLAPERRVDGIGSGDWYEWLGMGDKLLSMNKLLISQGTAYGVILPSSDGRQLVVQILRPWEVEVIPDPRHPGSLSRAKEFRARVQVATDAEQTSYGVLICNRESVYIDHGGATGKVGVWDAAGSNPFGGRIPAWYARNGEPADGMLHAPLPLDMLAAQEAIILSLCDIDLIARFQSYGQRWTDGPLPSEIKSGPGGVLMLPERGQVFNISQPSPSVAQYLASVAEYLRLVSQFSGLSYDGMVKGYQSALARQMGLADRFVYRLAHRAALRDAEARFVRVLGMCLAYMGLADVPDPDRVTVEVGFRDVPFPADPLAEAQAYQELIRMGAASAVDWIMQRERVDRPEAERRHRRYLEERDNAAGVGAAPDPGGMVE